MRKDGTAQVHMHGHAQQHRQGGSTTYMPYITNIYSWITCAVKAGETDLLVDHDGQKDHKQTVTSQKESHDCSRAESCITHIVSQTYKQGPHTALKLIDSGHVGCQQTGKLWTVPKKGITLTAHESRGNSFPGLQRGTCIGIDCNLHSEIS